MLSNERSIMRLLRVNKVCYCASLILKSALSTITKKQSNYHFISKTISRPDLSKLKGEDSYFSLPNDLAVYDGVGGWRTEGIDVSEFSELLAKSTKEYAEINHKVAGSDINLVNCLFYGLDDIKKNQLTGSSTACLLSMNSQTRKVNILNLGDSGAVVFRSKSRASSGSSIDIDSNSDSDDKDKSFLYDLVFQTQPQQHSFNFPFQTGNLSDKLKDSTHGGFDSPTVADLYSFQLEPQDLVLLATDGLFDNIFIEEVKEIVNKHYVLNNKNKATLLALDIDSNSNVTTSSSTNSDDILINSNKSIKMLESLLDSTVTDLVSTTLKMSLDKKRHSPFSVGYIEEIKNQVRNHIDFKRLSATQKEEVLKRYTSNNEYLGGKPDDITVTLAMVV